MCVCVCVHSTHTTLAKLLALLFGVTDPPTGEITLYVKFGFKVLYSQERNPRCFFSFPSKHNWLYTCIFKKKI